MTAVTSSSTMRLDRTERASSVATSSANQGRVSDSRGVRGRTGRRRRQRGPLAGAGDGQHGRRCSRRRQQTRILMRSGYDAASTGGYPHGACVGALRRAQAWRETWSAVARDALGAARRPWRDATSRRSFWKSRMAPRSVSARSPSPAPRIRAASRPALRAPADGHGRDGHAGGHLDDGVQGVDAVEVLEGHGDADDGQFGEGGEHAGQVGGAARRRR